MKPLQYYKKQIFIMGCLGMFPMLVFAQETLSSANALHGDYSGSRVERSADGDKLDIEFSIGLVEKLKSQQMMYISPRFVSVDGKKSVELKPMKFISLILPRNENKSITRENKTAVIQHFLKYIRWEQYLKSF